MMQKPIQKACTVDIRNPNVRFLDVFQIVRLLNRSVVKSFWLLNRSVIGRCLKAKLYRSVIGRLVLYYIYNQTFGFRHFSLGQTVLHIYIYKIHDPLYSKTVQTSNRTKQNEPNVLKPNAFQFSLPNRTFGIRTSTVYIKRSRLALERPKSSFGFRMFKLFAAEQKGSVQKPNYIQ